MEIDKITGAIEAILFASGEPVETEKIAAAVNVEEKTVYNLLKGMQDRYDRADSGIILLELNDSFQLVTRAEYAEQIKRVLEIKRNTPLSNAALEVLAIIAYNEPVTKSFIEQVRGVDSSQTVNMLTERGLVEEAGRLELPGRPISYQTTKGFLRSFGMKSLEELPPLPEEAKEELATTQLQA